VRAERGDAARVLRRLGRSQAGAFGPLEVAEPDRDGRGERVDERDDGAERQRLVGEGAAGGDQGLAEGDQEEEPEPLEQVLARDVAVRTVRIGPIGAARLLGRPGTGW
jgi:hypothetical protein